MSYKVQDKFHTVLGYLALNSNGNKVGKTWSKSVTYKALWFEFRLGTRVLFSSVLLVLEKLRDRTSRRSYVTWDVSSRGMVGIPALLVSPLQHPLCHEVKSFTHYWLPTPLQALNKPTDRTMDWNWSPDMFSLCKLIISNADCHKKCSLLPASVLECVRNALETFPPPYQVYRKQSLRWAQHC